jgi:hypothetical protein
MLSRAQDSSATLRDSIVRSAQRCGVTDEEERRRRNMGQPALAAPWVDELRSKVDGEVITPQNPAYLSDAAIDTIVAQAERLPAPFGQLTLAPMGGAVSRTDSAAMALSVDDAP